MNDWKYALRQLARRPAFAALAVGTIALAVGATTAIFSVVDAVLWRPLPYPESSRLVTILNTYPQWRERAILSRFWDKIQLSYPEYEALRDGSSAYEAVALHRTDRRTYFGTDRPEVIQVGLGSYTLPAVLRVVPVMGRWFDAGEDRPGGPPVAVVRHEFWRSRLGGDSAVVGQTVRIDREEYTIIGVLPPGFRFAPPGDVAVPDVWLPIGRGANDYDEGNHSFDAVARLAAGITLTQAQVETETILRGGRSPEVRGARVVERKEQEVAGARPALRLVFGAVGLILLLACANVANLLLSRAVERDQEIGVRLAMGATRPRLARQVLVESLAIAVIGGLLGTGLAWWGTEGLVGLIPEGVPRLAEVHVDLRVLGFALLVSALAGLLFGLAPVYAATGRRVQERLKQGARQTAGRGRLQAGLIVAQVALTVVLLVGALLLVRSLRALGNVELGFEREQLLSFRVELPHDRYPSASSTSAFFHRLNERLLAIPGVRDASGTAVLPLSGESVSNSIWLEKDGPEDPSRPKPEVERRIVEPNFFSVFGITWLEGRRFTEQDDANAAPVMAVSRRARDELWEGRSPIGGRVELDDRWWTVVGVVEDVRDQHPAMEPQQTVYVPYAQWPRSARTIALRTMVAPESVADEVRRTVQALDPLLPITELRSMDWVAHRATAEHRFRALLVSAFGLLAALLASVGIFGVTAQSVARRTREVGLRVAFGATDGDVVRLVLARVGGLAVGGLALGLAGAVAAGRLLRAFLFGVGPTDPLTFVVIGVAVLSLALVAGLLPARRATRIDPMEALRYE